MGGHEQQAAAPRAQTLDATLERLTRSSVPGLSVVVLDARGAYESAAGVADLDSRRPATLDTVYLWFSMTKIATATAVMQLVEQNRLALEDPVRKHLPEFPAPRRAWPEVRVRNLLNHSAGLANPVPVRWVHPAAEPGRDPRAFTLELLARHGRLRYPAGSRASYSNLGYIALGEVISAAAGMRYEDYVRASILAPLGMTSTDFGYRDDMASAAATGYQPRLSPSTPLFRMLLPKGIVGPNRGRYLSFRRFCVDGAAYGGLVGSARDASRFMSAHLGGGRLDGVRMLSAESVAEMQTIGAHGRKLDVGLGWFRRRSDPESAERYLEHLGGGGGFFNMMRIYPDRGVGVLAMGNSTKYDHTAVAAAATS